MRGKGATKDGEKEQHRRKERNTRQRTQFPQHGWIVGSDLCLGSLLSAFPPLSRPHRHPVRLPRRARSLASNHQIASWRTQGRHAPFAGGGGRGGAASPELAAAPAAGGASAWRAAVRRGSRRRGGMARGLRPSGSAGCHDGCCAPAATRQRRRPRGAAASRPRRSA